MGRDHSIECETCGESYGGMNAESEEHECERPLDRNALAERDMRFRFADAMSTIAANLATAAALTKAYRLGNHAGWECAMVGVGLSGQGMGEPDPVTWCPNTRGEAAPGWRSER